MSDTKDEYLGDGAYARVDESGGVVLYTSNGLYPTNSVCLEPDVLRSFKAWLERNSL